MTRATPPPIIVTDQPGDTDNEVKTFGIEGMDVRGRAVRLGTAAEQIITAHDYPAPVAVLVGELLALTSLLGSILKFRGILTVQAKGDGAVPLLVADFASPGALRGYAQVDRARLAELDDHPSFKELVGTGHLAMTIDQGADMERYQGIVDLDGGSLAECAKSYFLKSEQTPTEVRLAAGRDAVSGHWRVGGIMVQHLAHGEEGGPRILDREQEEAWRRASVLMASVRFDELVDPQLDLNRLLFRLYHEDGVRVFDAQAVSRGCRCSEQRIANVLDSFPKEDLADMAEDSKLKVTCEFFNRTFEFDA